MSGTVDIRAWLGVTVRAPYMNADHPALPDGVWESVDDVTLRVAGGVVTAVWETSTGQGWQVLGDELTGEH